MTVATTVAPSPTGTSAKIADEVGVVFAHEYYTFLNKEPSRLHCFYNKDSTMSHGYQGEQIEVYEGQQAINEKIMALDFQDAKVLVSNLDCQESIHGGIVVQVLGEMSNKGGPAQKFVQTFFLAVQPRGYYVHNDIFRFLKDDYDEADEENEEEAAEEDEDLTEMYAEKAEEDGEDEAESLIETSIHEFKLDSAVATPEVAKAAPVEVHSPAVAPIAVTPAPVAEKEFITEKKSEKLDLAVPVKTETTPVTTLPGPAQTIQTESVSIPTSTPVPAPAPTPTGPPKPKTWANLAANNQDQWGTQATAAKAGSVTVAPTPTPTPAPAPTPSPAPTPTPAKSQTPTPTPPHNNHQGQNQGQGHGQGQGGRKFVEYHSIFIKNVNDRITEEQLREAFSKFGRIKHLDMTQKRYCAFMDFATPESVVAALKQRNVQVGNDIVLAEERRRGIHGQNNNLHNGPGGSANGRQGHYNNNNYANSHQPSQGSYRGGRGNSNGMRGGGPSDRKPFPNKPGQGANK
ncbi:hypothetical protein FBU30_006242 [Linnemannia zychae]|nr:hypothetical protein FBU30_006242 [Linnemannia zychae]